MYIGQYLPDGGNVYSPWFPREADNAVFTFETIDKGASGDLTVAVFHKNTETQGPGDSVSTTWSAIDSTSYESATVTGLKEMVRFKFTAATSWVMFRMLQPTWYDTAIA